MPVQTTKIYTLSGGRGWGGVNRVNGEEIQAKKRKSNKLSHNSIARLEPSNIMKIKAISKGNW